MKKDTSGIFAEIALKVNQKMLEKLLLELPLEYNREEILTF
ncbi:hypothetical protein [Thermodesulfatator autotrophicus]|nr:hypothetical protein [Thermodesulfatator autotrophicus]